MKRYFMFNFFWESFKTGFTIWISWLGAIGAITTIVIPLVEKIFDKIQIPEKYYIGLLIFTFISLLIGFILGTYQTYNSKSLELIAEKESRLKLEDLLKDDRSKKFATPDQLIGSHFQGLDIRLADLVRQNNIIQNKTFVDCRIFGPAVLFPGGHAGFINSVWEVDVSMGTIEDRKNSVYIPLPSNAKFIYGVIGLDNVDFRGCTFFNIALLGDENVKNEVFKIADGDSKQK